MAKYISGRQKNLKVGLSSYSENTTSLEVIGKVGIGTTNATSSLYVVGDEYVTGVVTATTFYGTFSGNSATATYATNAGVATYATSSGIATYAPNAGIATYATSSGIATYATNAGVSTYAINAGISTYATNAGVSTYATSSGIATYATSAGIATYATSAGIATYAPNAGVSTYATIAGYSTSSGIATYAPNAGIATYATSSGIATYATIAGYSTSSGIATYAPNAGVSTYATSSGIATYATSAGISTQATKLQNSRTFEITGDIVGSPISFDGTGNVSIAATIQPNSVALGSDTTGDYVQSITGTANQISVSVTSGESSTPVISIPSNPTLPGNVTIGNDLQVNRNLNVTGNITIGGTSAYVIVNDFRVSDADIILGFTTNISGADVSNDTTASHGGVAVASTEGSPLISLNIAGIETLPPTYKKIMWFKSGAFAGLNTDAWLTNYAFGVGTTQMPDGSRFAAGNFVVGQDDITAVRNINSTGIITATSFVGPLTGNASSATYATNAGVATYATNAGVATYATNAGIATYAPNAGIATYAPNAGIATYADNAVIATYATNAGISTYATNAGIATYATSAGIATYATSSGIATYATNAGIATYATSSGIATYATNAGIATYAPNAGIATNVIGGIASVTQLSVSGFSTVGVLTATSIGIGTTNPTVALWVGGSGYFIGSVSSANGFYVNGSLIGSGSISGADIVGTALSIAGISTLGTVQISSGIITSTNSGVVTYYGDGKYLQNVVGFAVSLQSPVSEPVYPMFANNTGVTTAGISTTELVFVPSSGNLGVGSTNPGSKLTVIGDVKVSGVVTATTFYGSASGLTDIPTTRGIVDLTNITTGTLYYPTFVSDAAANSVSPGTGTTTGFNVTSTKLAFNASTGSLGIGTTNPTASLTVAGNTANILIGKQYTNANAITLNGSTAAADYNILSTADNGLVINRPSGKTIEFAQADTQHAAFDTSNNLQLNSGSLAIGNFTPSYAIDAGNVSLNKAGRVGSVIFGTAGSSYGIVGYNAKPSALNAWTYDATDVASWVQFLSGGHVFYRAASGTAGNAITPLESARFDSLGNLGIATNNPSQTLHVQGNARVTGAFRDSTDSPGTLNQVLVSTITGTQWGSAPTPANIPGLKIFDTSIDNTLYVQPTGTLDRVGVGTTTTQITTFPASPPEYIIHSIHVTNISNGDAEITGGFLLNSQAVPASISVSVGQSGRAGVNTITVGSASTILVGMSVNGTGNIGETTGIGSTAGFQYNTYVTSVDGNVISLSKPMSGRAVGVATFTPVSKFASRLPVPVGSAVELLKQPMVLNALDSIVLQSTGAGTGIGSTSTAAISQTANSNILTVTAGAAITNFLSSGMLIQGTGSNTGIQTNTFVGVGYTPGTLSVPMTRPATSTLASQILSFSEVITPQDGALQATIVYQSSTDTSYQNGTGTVAISSNTTSVTAGLSSIPVAYYATGNTYGSTVQSIRVTNISDGTIYPGGDYPVSVGIGNSDTIFSWLAYNMVIPRNSSIELCEGPKRLGIGQSIFAIANTPYTIEIQVAGKQKTS